MSENNQLINVSSYDITNMIFADPQINTIPNSAVSYKRISISTRNPNGTVGDLLLPTTRLFSFGLSPNVNPDTGKPNGYSMPICLWDKNCPSKEEKEWTTKFNEIIERAKTHLLDNKDDIELYDLNVHLLNKFNPLYWKKEKGKIVEGTGPTLYPKLIQSKKLDKITSLFRDEEGNIIDPLTLEKKFCYITAVIKIESIFIGSSSKISMQVKLYEGQVKLMEMGIKPLLAPKRIESQPTVTEAKNNSKPLDSGSDEDDDDGSIENEPILPAKPAVTTEVKKAVTPVVKKVVPKK